MTNACWIRDCWDVPGSSNGVFEGNIARSGYKTANNKTAKLQNGDYYKTSKSQNGDYYKTATVTKRRKKIFQIFYKNHSKTKILYSKSIIHRNFIISNFISSITLSTGKILKIRPTVFPKYMLATKRQWFDHDASFH